MIDSLMDRSKNRSPLQIFEIQDLKNLIEQNYNLLVDLEKSKFRVRSVNHSYLIVTNLGKFVLRISSIHRYMNHSLEDFKFEMETLNYLHLHNFPVICPLRRHDGEFVALVEMLGKKYYYALFCFATGKPILELNENQYYNIGKILARIHVQWDLWKPTYTRFSYNEETMFDTPIQLIEKYLGKGFPEYLTAIVQFRDYARKKMQVISENKNYNQWQGIIHGDLHKFNMHFEGDEITIFDFDSMGYGLRIFDVASFIDTQSINKSKEPLDFNTEQSFLNGYNSIRELSSEEINLIPTMKVIRMIITFGLWAHLIGTKSFEKEHKKMSKYIIGLFREAIPRVADIIANDGD